MWIVFGFVALSVSCIVAWIARRESLWVGTPMMGGHEWGYSADGKENQRVRIAVPAPAGIEFSMHPEREFDRWAKAIGICVEQEVGNDAFDRRIYMESDDVRISRLLAADKKLCDALLEIFDGFPEIPLTSVRKVQVIGRRLRVDIRCPNGKEDQTRDAALAKLLPRMKQVAAALAPVADEAGKTRDTFAWRATLVLALSSGILASGALELLAYGTFDDSRVLEFGRLVWFSLPVGAAITIAMVVLTFSLLGRSSRTHIVLAEVLTLGLIGSLALAYTRVQEVNETFDKSPTVMVDATVERTYVTHGRRSGTRYYVVLDSPDPLVNGESIRVSYGLYSRAKTGQAWELEKRAGALGIAWLQAYGPSRLQPATNTW